MLISCLALGIAVASLLMSLCAVHYRRKADRLMREATAYRGRR